MPVQSAPSSRYQLAASCDAVPYQSHICHAVVDWGPYQSDLGQR